MMSLMARRGPDDAGFWQDPHCTVGFRRLSILDLSPNGHQPMCSQDGRFILVMNGEVYNFLEIKRDLAQRGYHFRSTGDAEVVLSALSEWGLKALERFNGMFALAFYDSQEKTLLLARDHAGIKPLFYSQTSQGLVFASQYNQIVQHPWTKNLQVSGDALSMYLRFGWIPAPYGLLEDTHLLEAGGWMQVDSFGHVKEGRFYDFPQYSSPNLMGEEAVDALDEALDRAVKRHLVSDVPVGVFLSGGIDSPLVAARARQISGQRLKAFTIGVDDPLMDETQEAQGFASAFDLEHVLQMTTEESALELLEAVTLASTEPTADFSMFPTLMVSRLAGQQVKVVLTGDGGDELFWGYPGRFVPTLEQSPYYRLPKFLRYGSIAMRKSFGLGKATRESLYPSLGRLYQKKHTLLAESDLRNLFPNLCPIPGEVKLFEFSETNIDTTAQWLRWNEFTLHLARVLMKADRASMHCSLETRLPLLDKEVIAIAIQTDWRTCLDLKNRVGKIPLRKLLNRHTNQQSVAKKGFTVPMAKWLHGPLHDLLEDKVINRPGFLGMEVDRKTMIAISKKFYAGDQSKACGLWLLLSLVLWEETHLLRKG
jgi:asparagine synthase (glutamine-hydrolysing)